MSNLDLEDRDPDEGDPEPAGLEEVAFQRATTHEFKKQRLHPFSFLRQTAVVGLGLRYGFVSEEEIERRENPRYRARLEAEETLRGKKIKGKARKELEELVEVLKDEEPELISYSALTADAARVVWICLQPDSVCMRVRRKPREYESAVDKWAEKEGIRLGSAAWKEAVAVFNQIMAEVKVSEGKPDVEKDESESPN